MAEEEILAIARITDAITKQLAPGVMKDQNRTTVLREFDRTTEANIVKSMLESNGIPCFLSNENSVFTPGFFSATSKILLHVMEDDFEKANALINQSPDEIDEEKD